MRKKRTKRRSTDEWRALILEGRSSGIPITRWCSEHHIDRRTFYEWERKLNPGLPLKEAFVEIVEMRNEVPKADDPLPETVL